MLTKKHVQNVTEKKPKSEPETMATQETKIEPVPQPQPAEVVNQKEAPAVDIKEGSQEIAKLIEIPQVDEDTKRMLRKAGFEWDSVIQAFEKINIWAEKVDKTQKVIIDTISGISNEKIAEILKEKVLAVREQERAAAEKIRTSQPSSGDQEGGGGGGSGQFVGKVIMKALEGEEKANPLSEKMNKFFGVVLDNAIARISQPSRFEQLLDEEIAKTKVKAIVGMVTQTEGAK